MSDDIEISPTVIQISIEEQITQLEINPIVQQIQVVDQPINVIIQPQITQIEIQSQGLQGAPGEGVATGGTTGQILAKASNTNFDTEWIDDDAAIWGQITGTLSDQTDLQAALDLKADASNVYTKAEIDTLVGQINAALSGLVDFGDPT